MSHTMVQRLIYKDWYFNRWAIAAMVGAGLVSLVPIAVGGTGAFYAGSILLISALISVGIQVVFTTVLYERDHQTLAFVMSLPVSAREYTTAKLAANLAIFVGAWVMLVVGAVAVIAGRPAIPDGLIPFTVVVLFQIFVGYVLLLAVALARESQAWAIGAIVAGNFLLQGVMYWISHVPAVEATLKTDTIAWHHPIPAFLGAELAAIVLVVALTYYLQSRKTDFL